MDFKCLRCYQIFQRIELLSQHEIECKRNEDGEAEICEDCPNDDTNKVEKTYSCKNCDQRFAQKSDFKVHEDVCLEHLEKTGNCIRCLKSQKIKKPSTKTQQS